MNTKGYEIGYNIGLGGGCVTSVIGLVWLVVFLWNLFPNKWVFLVMIPATLYVFWAAGSVIWSFAFTFFEDGEDD